MALPKLEFKGSRFTLTEMIKSIEQKLSELRAPFTSKPPKREESGYKPAPGPREWEEVEEVTEKTSWKSELGEGEIAAKKMFPEKKTTMDSKRMHKPRVKRPKIKRGKARGKLQKNL